MGKHGHAYAKRRKLKTEGLYSEEGKAEILGSASRKRKREEEEDADSDEDEESIEQKKQGSLQSVLLKRTMELVPKFSFPPASLDDSVSRVTITKPDPRPPVATETPFNV